MSAPIVLIDLSSIARPIYESAIDVLGVHTKIVQAIRELASGQPHVAICCDSGKSFRKDIDSSYKANRSETPQTYVHQLDLAVETLRGDGFPVWAAAGFEADDLIASAVHWLSIPVTQGKPSNWPKNENETTTLVISADKDLRQLVSERVQVFRPGVGSTPPKTFDVAAVVEKYSVQPLQLLDYFSLVGDRSDNVVGARGIGDVTAAKLLNKYGNLDDMFAAIDKGEDKWSDKALAAMAEFRARMPIVRQLLTLRTDAPILFEEVFRERVPTDAAVFGEDDDIAFAMPTLGKKEMPVRDAEPITSGDDPDIDAVGRTGSATLPTGATRSTATVAQVLESMDAKAPSGQPVAIKAPKVVPASTPGPWNNWNMPAPQQALVASAPRSIEWELEPRNIEELKAVARIMFATRLFSQWGTEQAVFAIIQAGRELGLQTQGALRGFHNIDNKPMLSAGLMRALVLSSGKAEYFQCVERTPMRATWRTLRKGNPQPTELTYTIEEAQASWTKSEQAWKLSGWTKNSADMCSARASSKLARLEYDDVLFGLYAREEFE